MRLARRIELFDHQQGDKKPVFDNGRCALLHQLNTTGNNPIYSVLDAEVKQRSGAMVHATQSRGARKLVRQAIV